MRSFGSDNHSGVHPNIMKALVQANIDHAPSYGTDSMTEEAVAEFKKHFGEKAQVFFVFNGTAANVLSLSALCRSYQSIFVSQASHLWWDECAAPEFFFRGRLHPITSSHGKIIHSHLEENFIRRGDQHFAQVQAISLTQPTEVGTCYSLDEMKKITSWAKSKGLLIHIDGARIANAATSLNCSFKEITSDLGVDIVSFGGTKNGLMMGEAIVILNPEIAKDFKYLRKQAAQLPSKTRFIACQFKEYFKNDLWRDLASHSLQMAKELYLQVSKIPGIEVTLPVDSNAVFAKIPKKWVKPLREKYFFYIWDENTFECRWMTSWDTTLDDVQGFTEALKKLSEES